ncbi:uncharacterized protein LOC136028982 [Artemia franciscana]|uniref:uncharacterized protein LOC136028982 n=1 Tax=Artemia franciscana TaxID=6661 RepID=UPI0032DBF02F
MGESTKWLIGLLTLISFGSRYADGINYELTVIKCPELQKLNEFQKNSLLTDIVVESQDGQKFEAHKVILAAQSEKLRDLILVAEALKPCTCEKTEIKLPVEGKDLNDTLEFVYSGKIRVENDTVQPLLEVADKLGLDELTETIIDNFLSPLVTDTTLVTMITTTTPRPTRPTRPPHVEQGILDNVKAIEEISEERAADIIKKFDPQLMEKYLDQTDLEPNKLAEPIAKWIKDKKEDDRDEPEAIAEVLEKVPFDQMNCTALKKIADELLNSTETELAETSRVFFAKIMELSTNGEGACYTGCADCERSYAYKATLDYKAGTSWNTTILLPHQVPGKEFLLGRFRAGTAAFIASLQMRDRQEAPYISMSGLMLQFIPPSNGKIAKRDEKREFDIEISIARNGAERDCPLRNRFRYRFDSNTNIYKWFSRLDPYQDYTITILLNDVA